MAYEHKNGQGAAFKNINKKEDKHPDMKGTFKDLDGTLKEIAIWKKVGKKGEFWSFSVSLPRNND